MKADEIKVLQDIKEAVDGYAIAFDPCNMCKHQDRTKKDNLETCLRCCYFYASNFELKRKNVKGEKNGKESN